jgi:hypothetical protein
MSEEPEEAVHLERKDIAKQWTPMLKDAGFTAVSNIFLKHYRNDLSITNTEAMLIIQLMQHKWDERAPYPSFKTLSHRMGLTDQQVRVHALSLVKKGLMKKTLRFGKPNLFHMEPLFTRLEEIYVDQYQKHPDPTAKPKETRAKRTVRPARTGTFKDAIYIPASTPTL